MNFLLRIVCVGNADLNAKLFQMTVAIHSNITIQKAVNLVAPPRKLSDHWLASEIL